MKISRDGRKKRREIKPKTVKARKTKREEKEKQKEEKDKSTNIKEVRKGGSNTVNNGG